LKKETRMFDPVHPGEVLKEDVLAPTGLTVAKAAEVLGVGRPALSAVLNGRASLSPEMALRFEKAFGVSMDLMLKMQLQYDIAHVRKAARGITVKRFKPAA
jgi:addiction module HigA family antidote